jgi:solute carrier family 25 carnitine/acylcarnitine transporter 20/29
MYFMTYELVQNVLKQHSKSGEIGVLSTVFAGGSAGIANWLVAMPADVLKSRLQTGRYICYEVLGDELISCDG